MIYLNHIKGSEKLRSITSLFFYILILSISVPGSASLELSLFLNPQINQYRESGLFSIPTSILEQPEIESNQVLEWKTEYSGLNLLGNWQLLIDENETQENKGSMLEAYYSNTVYDIDFSIGKKITSWGIGNAFRPIDIVLNQNLLSTSDLSLEGTAQLSFEYFRDLSSVTMIIAPDSYQGDLIALRFFDSKERGDYQLLLANSKNSNWQAGGAGVWIANDKLALHVEALLQQNYSKQINKKDGASALFNRTFTKVEDSNGLRFLFGSNYSWDNNNIIVEYWFDELAYTKSQWQDLLTLSENQKSQLGIAPDNAVYGNLAKNLSATNKAYLMQHNLFFRWTQEVDTWVPSFSGLFSLEDEGLILTAELQRSFESLNAKIGIRHYTGNTNSVYNKLLLQSQIYLSVNSTF